MEINDFYEFKQILILLLPIRRLYTGLEVNCYHIAYLKKLLESIPQISYIS